MNRHFLIIVSLFCFISCKKDIEPWDKEANLATDTSLYLNKVAYVSHSATEAYFDLEFVQFNQLNCESVYDDVYFNEGVNSNFQITPISQSAETLTPVAEYSSLFLFEGSGYELYFQGEASFYLRRYFEFIEANGANKRIGMATYISDDYSTINFHKEDGTLFGNSAAYNDSVLVDLIHRSELTDGIDNSGNGLIQVMFAAIDELVTNPSATGDKSITLFDDYENNFGNGYATWVIDSIANKAITNNVKINVVVLNAYNLSSLALRTGGFVIDQRESNKINYFDQEYALSNIGNNLANLDLILSQNLTVNSIQIKAAPYYGVVINSDDLVEFDLIYNNDFFRVTLKIP